MIEIIDVSKRYGSFLAVDRLSLSVCAGEIFAFLGVNGAGKTTTLSMLAGLLEPSSGTIKIGGWDLSEEPTKAKSIIGYIPDRPYLYPKVTGREFLYFVGDLYQVPFKRLETRIDELLAEFRLLEWQNELTESYSHGMKQRLATCAALVHDPKVLIIDEPMVGLDPHGARFFKQVLKRFAQAGNCIFLSTHSLNVAEEISDRLAIIDRGKIIASGTLIDVKQASGALAGNLEDLFLQMTSSGNGS